MDLDDEQVERRLKGLRPVDPPSSLRARVMASAQARQTRVLWIWLPAAAAVLAALLLNWRASLLYDELQRPRIDAERSSREAEIELISRSWGDTPSARDAATRALDAINEASQTRPHTVSPEGSIR